MVTIYDLKGYIQMLVHVHVATFCSKHKVVLEFLVVCLGLSSQ